MKNLEITLVRSLIAIKPKHRKTAHALGLRKPNQKVVRKDTETIRGMVRSIAHLVHVVEK